MRIDQSMQAREAREAFLRIIESSPSLQRPFRKEIKLVNDFLLSMTAPLAKQLEASIQHEAEKRKKRKTSSPGDSHEVGGVL